MKNIVFPIFLLCLIFGTSCKNDDAVDPDPEQLDYERIDVVTGIDFFDELGNPIGRSGFPNHKKGDALVYPIPNNGEFNMNSQDPIERIWLVPAACNIETVNSEVITLAEDLSFSIADIESIQVKDLSFSSEDTFQVGFNFGDVETGMYRLFYQLESDEIFWYNLYIDPSVTNFPNFDFMDTACN